MYKGIGASAGIGIGKIVKIKEEELNYTKQSIEDIEAEKKRLSDAIEVFIEKTQKMVESMKVTAGEQEAEILEGHIMMIQDPAISEQIEAKIEGEKINAEAAVEEACDFFAQIFAMADDELTQQRASDLGDIKTRLIKILLGIEEVDISAVPEGTILVAEDLTPSMTAGINPANVQGVLTEIGGKTSHSAIICRSMEIPAVLSIENIVSIVNDGDEVVLDGSTGEAYINPEASVVEEYKAKKEKFLEEKVALQKFVGQKSQTADGHVVELVANIGGPDEAEGVLERDGEGVGLFRSEFLFMESDAIPSEEAQFEAYKKVAETLDGKPVIIRTLDIGGDKALPYLGLPTEENPFLGFRAVRFCLQRKEDIYKPQLRALLRASAFGKVRIMVPLVTCVDELRAVKAIIEELKQELDAEGIAYDKDIQVGVMMETAAASLIADILAKEADFFSIGTNDLTGYTMAADRGNPDVAYLYSAYNPAVLRSIRNIISAANKEDIMAGMCGEAASDPLLVPVLLGFGLNEFSVSATAILATRKVMSLWTMDECKALVDEVMQLETEAEVKALLEERARS
jgi:phosphotransferase system enzyme I (PtsI)